MCHEQAPGAMRSPPVASRESCRLLSSTPFQRSSGEMSAKLLFVGEEDHHAFEFQGAGRDVGRACHCGGDNGCAGVRATNPACGRTRTAAGCTIAKRTAAASRTGSPRLREICLGDRQRQSAQRTRHGLGDHRDHSRWKHGRDHQLQQRVVRGDVEWTQRLRDCPKPRHRKAATGETISRAARIRRGARR